MNKVILTGRIAKDPEILKVGSSTETAVTRYVLAVEKKPPPEIGSKVDFISITAFGKDAIFAARWFLKGTRVTVMGRIQTGSYTSKDGRKIYTTDIIAMEQEFGANKEAEKKAAFVPPPFTDDLKEEQPIEPPEPKKRKGRR